MPQGERILVVGGRGSSTLTAAYRFCEALGCRFLAPTFDHYKGSAEYVPHSATLTFSGRAMGATPALKYRKLYVEEGLTHDIASLRQLAEWMPKAGYNVLVTPTNYEGHDRVKWDNWHVDLTPELQKRDIIIEVGGHGYQNFIRADMPDPSGQGTLFDKHPDWFAQDERGNRHKEPAWVFNTANEEATAFMIGNVTKYLSERPEIQIFDCWPPDGEHWDQSEAGKKQGSPTDRMVLLTNRIARELAKLRPGLRAECIAYSHFTQAPTVPLDPSVLVDFCPINQSFVVQIDDATAKTNADYVRDLQGWRKAFGGDISIYSYYRKYAWQSLPTVLPHYIQKDLQFYAKVPVQGMSTYSEPGDWFAYELNHYALARLAWDPSLDVDALIRDFCEHRYGSAAPVAMQALDLLEQTVRTHGTLPFTPRPPAPELASAAGKIRDAIVKLEDAASTTKDPAVRYNLGRLGVCCEYACRDIDLARMKAEQRPAEEMQKGLGELEALIQSHTKEGEFAINGIRLGHKQLEDRYFGRRR